MMADSLACHIGPEAASFVHAVFSLHDHGELQNLATQAGFEHVDVRLTEVSLEFPPPAEFLWRYVWSTPLAATVAQADEERRRALEHDFSERCRALAWTSTRAGSVRMSTLIAVR
jgi:hypothetical protein